jgi:glycosyltransferase involved in cell wall biosynthesis
MPPSHVAWLGVDPFSRVRSADRSSRPTFVTLGTIEGRKNHLLLLKIWSRLVDRLGSAAPRLLIVGQRGWEAQPALELLDRSEKLRGHVIELGHCLDAELAAHLTAARALLFPSFTEGYGMPMVEALGAGAPVIASDLPVFRELCGTIPTYLSPLDESGWETAIMNYAQPGSPERASQCQRMKAFHAPTWEEHFNNVEAWLWTLG